MSLEVRVPCAGVSTLLAAERFLSSVNKNMPFQISSRGAQEGTHIAAIAFLSSFILDRLGGSGHCKGFDILSWILKWSVANQCSQ